MTRPVALSFDQLRSWEGSQARAFEELSYQLLKNQTPVESTAIRTGNPDGGVEWYARLTDGSEWGWQAKHIHGIEPLLAAMTESVRRVVLDRPGLMNLTFVISWNLATSTQGGRKKSQRQKYEDKVASWKAKIHGADTIDFRLIQGSDLLNLLALPEHRGRRWFWWGEPVLTSAWLQDRLAEQADAAGEKYRPDLQVDLPIQEDLKALGFDESTVAEFERLRRRVVSSGHEMRMSVAGEGDLADRQKSVVDSAEALTRICQQTVLLAGTVSMTLPPIAAPLERFITDVRRLESFEYELERKWRELPKDDPDREAKKPAECPSRYSVTDLRDSALAMESWLESTVGVALQRRLYFLVGPAGSGKTHLFLDAVQRALAVSRPAIALAGAQFGRGDLWASICDQLGLPPVGGDVLLGAIDAAGEAAATTGRRFLILIDALNETPSADFWSIHLPMLRAAVARWPHVALAVSCRDTYVEIVADAGERSLYQERTHPGFAGRELEATQRYFEHYRLEAPRIPLLVPEFSLPLFLRLYCESLAGVSPALDAGHEGRIRIFERYMQSKLVRVARRLRPNAASSYELECAQDRVTSVIDAILDEMAATGSEAIPRARGEQIATSVMGGSAEDATIVLGALQSEGLLARDLLYLGAGKSGEGFRIVFQAFADFLILRRRIERAADPKSDASLRTWLREECSLGILDAASVALPELYDVELPDFLELAPTHFGYDQGDDLEARRRANRARSAYRSLVETLPYRKSEAVTDRTIELLNQSLPLLSRTDFFRTIFLIAPQPANPLNGEGLHRYLLKFKMPRRDAYFGIAMYGEIWDESSPVVTLARWASGGPYPAYDPYVVELAAIPLVWLLSSPNRFMRDWLTKALVQLLRGHLDVALRLVDRFYVVDDPYIVQRIVVVAYGALMRSDPARRSDAAALSARIHDLVFAQPIKADELLLDAARGVVEWAVARGLLPAHAIKETRRPYGLTPPSMPPTEQALERKYGFKAGNSAQDSYSAIWFSLMGMGDFARYVVESGVSYFTRYRLDAPYPVDVPPAQPRLVKRRWQAFMRSLSDEQRSEILKVSGEGGGSPDLLGATFWPSLSDEQRDLLRSVWRQPSDKRWRDETYPGDRACRWVLRRTTSLGWKPSLFGEVDRTLGHGRGREEHKAERWGKKYQWIAYHELLARVADNYHASRRLADDRPYEGLYQICGDREIDPSLPPVDYRSLVDDAAPGRGTWRPSPVEFPDWPPARIDFARYRGDVTAFIGDRVSEPTLDKIMFMADSGGNRWVTIAAYLSQGDPAADKHWRGLQQPFSLNSWFCPSDQAPSILPHLAAMRDDNRWDLVDSHGHVDCCYAGEIGWSPHSCSSFHRDLMDIVADGDTWRLVSATETVQWEGSLLDCSIGETVSAEMPSSFVLARARLRVDEAGPSWRDDGELVMTRYVDESRSRGWAFLVRASWLSAFLRSHGLELVAASWHRRYDVHDHPARADPDEEVYAAARIDADLNLQLAAPIRERR